MTTTTQKRFKKDFNELTDSGQKARLQKYEEERAERGTKQILGRLVSAPSIQTIKGDAKSAFMNIAVNHTDKPTEYIRVSAYIAKDKVGGELEAFYASLEKGQLVSVEYKENGKHNNAYSVFKREVR